MKPTHTAEIPAADKDELELATEEFDSDEYYYSEDGEEDEETYGLEDGLREVMDQDWADASGGEIILIQLS